MILKLFRNNQIFASLFTSLLTVLLWYASGFHNAISGVESTCNSALLYVVPTIRQIDSMRAVSSAINLIVLVFCSVYFSRIFVRYQIIPQRTSLPSLMLILISAPYFQLYSGISFPLLSFFILLIILDMLFSTIDSKTTSMRFFDSALILSIASLINFYFLCFTLFLIFVWIQFRGFGKWRELVYIFIGIAIPYLFYFTGLYLADIDIRGILNANLILCENRHSIPLSIPLYALGGLTALLILVASIHIIQKYMKMKIVTRKYSLIFLSLFTVILLITIFYPGIGSDIIFFLSLPIAFLFSYYFSTCRMNLFSQILLILLIAGNIFILFWK
jgi:hypothetical protein